MGQFVINYLKDYKIAHWIVTLGPKQIVSWDWKPRVENPVLWSWVVYLAHDKYSNSSSNPEGRYKKVTYNIIISTQHIKLMEREFLNELSYICVSAMDGPYLTQTI